VLDAGRLVESGKHQELLDRNGMYRRLYDLQFASAVDNSALKRKTHHGGTEQYPSP